jgi:hypothetical protein
MLRRNLERERREIQQRLLRVQRDRPDDEAAGNALLAEYQRLTERMGEMDRAEIPSRGVEHS